MSQVAFEITLVMANVQGNNNKFWKGVAYEDGSVDTNWGRVGTTGQNRPYHKGNEDFAVRFVKSKMREKEKKGYKPLEVANSNSGGKKSLANKTIKKAAEDQIITSSEEVRDLIRKLVDQNIHNILSVADLTYDADTGLFSTPLGIVTEKVIQQAESYLNQLADLVKDKRIQSSDFIPLAENYLMCIPQKVGRKLDPHAIFSDIEAIKKQNNLLEDLKSSLEQLEKEGDKKTQEVEIQKDIFRASMELNTDSKVLKDINDFFDSTKQSVHASSNFKVARIFDVNIEGMTKEFESCAEDIGNIQRLWHGTRVGNILSMLKSGMIIPKSSAGHVTGRMFGDGLYFSDQSTKSLNYAHGYWDGRQRDKVCYMFLCDVAMGKEYIPDGYSYSTKYPKKGYNSTFAIGSRGNSGKSSAVYNNEMIVYETSQAKPVYLVEFVE